MKLHKTQNNISSNVKENSIALLNEALANTIDLALATKQAHWNIKGASFIAIHELLDKLRDGLDEKIDVMAERLVQLGGTALGTTQIIAKDTSLSPYPTEIYSSKDHLDALIERFGKVANQIRKSIKSTADAGDDTTADVFTEASRELDKSLWFLEAHIQDK